MNPCHARTSRTVSHRRWSTYAAALAGACVAMLPALSAHALTPPAVPIDVEVPTGHKLFRLEHAVGTQNYVCRTIATPPGFAWAPFGPQATLFTNYGRQTATHFLSPNPDEGGLARPTWQDSRDTSSVWAMQDGIFSDPPFVDPDAIPWLRLRVVGAEPGPTGGGRITRAGYLQRLNTSGGKAPTTGCSEDSHVGGKALVPYTADYLFYRATGQD